MNNDLRDKLVKDILDEAFEKLELGNVCRSREDRPLVNHKYSLWSDGDTVDAFGTTTIAWDIFKPVNG